MKVLPFTDKKKRYLYNISTYSSYKQKTKISLRSADSSGYDLSKGRSLWIRQLTVNNCLIVC